MTELEARAQDIAERLEIDMLPNMQGDKWDFLTYPQKRILFDVYATRRAKLEQQQKWMAEERKKHMAL